MIRSLALLLAVVTTLTLCTTTYANNNVQEETIRNPGVELQQNGAFFHQVLGGEVWDTYLPANADIRAALQRAMGRNVDKIVVSYYVKTMRVGGKSVKVKVINGIAF